ncbi:MAG: type II toxin-antitoxin system RelE/ParE family toxin [Oscillospiraceae bacterium]|nr:type II toxin-antitoxin system RelE/ParE family toxin [Oscillospiraceae bacterium]
MNKKVVYSAKTLTDLEEIGDYISKELKNPIAALNTVNMIQNKIDKLADFPNIGTPLSAIYDTLNADDYRFLVCANYLAFYRVGESNIHIDRVLYGKRDYAAILFGNLTQNEHKENAP